MTQEQLTHSLKEGGITSYELAEIVRDCLEGEVKGLIEYSSIEDLKANKSLAQFYLAAVNYCEY